MATLTLPWGYLRVPLFILTLPIHTIASAQEPGWLREIHDAVAGGGR
jgi:hypothetical protein